MSESRDYVRGWNDGEADAERLRAALTGVLESLRACAYEDERRHADDFDSDLVCGAVEVALLYGGGLVAEVDVQQRLHDALVGARQAVSHAR